MSLMIIVIVMLAGIYSSAIAATDFVTESDGLTSKLKSISYPAFAKSEKLNGDVVVSFSINDSGKIVIDKVDGTYTELVQYVKEQFKKVKLDINASEIGKNFYCRFKFKLL